MRSREWMRGRLAAKEAEKKRTSKAGPALTGERARLLRKGITNVHGIEQAYIYRSKYHSDRIEALATSGE